MIGHSWPTLIALALAGAPATVQTPPPAPDAPALGSTIAADSLRDLPASNNVFSFLETTQAEVISDRFDTGG